MEQLTGVWSPASRRPSPCVHEGRGGRRGSLGSAACLEVVAATAAVAVSSTALCRSRPPCSAMHFHLRIYDFSGSRSCSLS